MDGEGVPMPPEALDGPVNGGRYHTPMAPLLAGMGVREVEFHFHAFEGTEGIGQGPRVMGKGTGVHDDGGATIDVVEV